MRVRRVVLHVGRINRLLGARRHEYLRRQVLIPNRPVVQAFRHICVRNHAPARDGLTKFRVVLLLHSFDYPHARARGLNIVEFPAFAPPASFGPNDALSSPSARLAAAPATTPAAAALATPGPHGCPAGSAPRRAHKPA